MHIILGEDYPTVPVNELVIFILTEKTELIVIVICQIEKRGVNVISAVGLM